MASTTPGPAPSPERPPPVGVADPAAVADRLRLDLVLRAGGFGTWVWDSATAVVHWDPELEAVFGWAAGTFPGTYDAWRECLHPDDREAVVTHVRDAVERRGTYEIRHRIVWPDGSVHWIEGLGQVTLGPDGTATGTIGCARDVTRRIEGEERLAAAALASASAAARTELLQTVTADLAGAVSVDDVVRALARHADGLSHAQAAAVGLLGRSGRTIEISSSFGFSAAQLQGFEHVPLEATTPLSVCVRTGREIVLTRVQMIERFPALAAATAGTGSTLLAAMPLLVGGSTLGALLLAFRGPVDADQLDLPLLRAVATQSAQALDRARLIGRLGEVAEQLQSAMEPDRLPSVPGFELASVYRPGGDELEHVGGDWFDLVELDEGRYAFSIGDVMGRGVLASTTMTRIRTAMRAYASVDGAPLAVVSTLDRFARTEAPDDFVTLVYGVLDTATGHVRLVNAGHLPPALAGPDGAARLVDDESSVPLGLHGCRVEAEVHLAPGSDAAAVHRWSRRAQGPRHRRGTHGPAGRGAPHRRARPGRGAAAGGGRDDDRRRRRGRRRDRPDDPSRGDPVTEPTPAAVPEPAARASGARGVPAWVPIAIAGELDLYSAPGLREQVLKAVNAGRLHLVLDLSAGQFVDSSGFAVMVSAYKRVRALGGQMRVCCADKQVSSAMRVSGLDRVFEVFPDMAAATRAAACAGGRRWMTSRSSCPRRPPARGSPATTWSGCCTAGAWTVWPSRRDC